MEADVTKAFSVALAALALVVAGCGGEQDKGPSNSVDQGIAEGSLLTLGDFPAGWEEKSGDANDDASDDFKHQVAQCLEVDYDILYGGASGTASSDTFVSGDDVISDLVQVSTTESRMVEGFKMISGARYRGCVQSGYGEYVKDAVGDDTKIGDVQVDERPFDQFGDQTIAFRITIPVTYQERDGFVINDQVVVRVGRAFTQITAQSTNSPFDVEQLSNLVEIATDRLAERVGATPEGSPSPPDTTRPSIAELERSLAEPTMSGLLEPFGGTSPAAVECAASVLHDSDVSDQLLIQIVEGTFEGPSAEDGPFMQDNFSKIARCVDGD